LSCPEIGLHINVNKNQEDTNATMLKCYNATMGNSRMRECMNALIFQFALPLLRLLLLARSGSTQTNLLFGP